MTADDATMNLLIWIHIHPFLKSPLDAVKFINILKVIQLMKV